MSALIQLQSERADYLPEPNVPREVVEFWAGCGIEVDPYGPPLANGLPHGVNKVSFRNGRIPGQAIDHKRISLPRRLRKRDMMHDLPSPPAEVRRTLAQNPIDLVGCEKYIEANFGGVDKCLYLNQIARLVAHFHGYSVTDLKGRRRFKRLVMARQQAVWHMYERTDASYPAIGRFLGGRDHSTLIHGRKVHEARLAEAIA